MHIVFVCTGNICRSTFAERYAALVDAEAGGSHHFSSVGVGAVIGAPMEELMAERLVARGGSPEGFIARQLNYDAIADADLLLPLESTHRRILIEEYPQLHGKAFVLRSAARLASEAPNDVDRVEWILQHRPSRTRGDSIADPYRRGPAAADEAAAQITEAIDTIFG